MKWHSKKTAGDQEHVSKTHTYTGNIFIEKERGNACIFILFGMVIYTFISNVLEYQGMDIAEMYHPMKLMLLSYNRVNEDADMTGLLIQLYPFLVVLPAGFSLSKEYQLGEQVYLSARLGNRAYKWCKVLAAFLATAIVFSVPFHPYIYALVGILLFGLVSGLFGAVTVVISSFIRVKYNVFLFLPSLILLNLTVILPTEQVPFSLEWYDYLLLFNDERKNSIFFAIVVAGLLVFATAGTFVSSRKDCL